MQELCRLPRPRLTQVSTHMQVPQKAQREDGGPRPGLGATGCGGLKAGAPPWASGRPGLAAGGLRPLLGSQRGGWQAAFHHCATSRLPSGCGGSGGLKLRTSW